MEEETIRDHTDNTETSNEGQKLSLKELKKKYSHINFDKTSIQIPGKTEPISLSNYIEKYNKNASLDNLKSLDLFFHGFLGGDTGRKIRQQKYKNRPLICIAWKGFSGKRSRLASKELANLLSNELCVNPNVKINTASGSMGNVAAGSFVAQMLENESVKANNIKMSLFVIAKTHFLSSLIVRAKPNEILKDISDENLKQIYITTPNSRMNIDPIHSPNAVRDFYNHISQRLYNKKLSFKEIWELQGKHYDKGVVQTIGTVIEEKQKNNVINQENNSNDTMSNTEQKVEKSKDAVSMNSLPSKSNKDKLHQP